MDGLYKESQESNFNNWLKEQMYFFEQDDIKKLLKDYGNDGNGLPSSEEVDEWIRHHTVEPEEPEIHAELEDRSYQNKNVPESENNQVNYHQILEVSPDASESEIKKAYRKMAMKYHPDRNPGDKEAEENFKKIQEDYEKLTGK